MDSVLKILFPLMFVNLWTLIAMMECPKNTSPFCICDAEDYLDTTTTVECKDTRDPTTEVVKMGDFKMAELILRVTNVSREKLPANFFSGIEKLTFLFISQSPISSVDPNAFAGFENILRHVSFENTKLNSIPILKGLNILESLMIKSSSQFKKQLTSTDTDNLPENIGFLNLQNNDIESIGDGAFTRFPKLRGVDLKNNMISKISADAIGKHLSKLYLQKNALSKIPIDALKIMKDGSYIDLIDNKVKQIPRNEFAPLLDKKMKIDLIGNPIECSCEMDWLPKYMVLNNLVNHANNWGRCYGENNRITFKIKLLNEADFDSCK